jgi:hypothetical protein
MADLSDERLAELRRTRERQQNGDWAALVRLEPEELDALLEEVQRHRRHKVICDAATDERIREDNEREAAPANGQDAALLHGPAAQWVAANVTPETAGDVLDAVRRGLPTPTRPGPEKVLHRPGCVPSLITLSGHAIWTCAPGCHAE